MDVFLTGATGFVGSYVLQALRDHAHTVTCLLRDTTAPLSVDDDGVARVEGDVTDPASLQGTLDGCDAVIHLVGIIDEQPSKGVTFERIHTEGTRHVVEVAQNAGIGTFIHMSANGAAPEGTGYQTSKWEAERIVGNANFEHWCIMRPSIVFGDPGPHNIEFASRLVDDLIRPFPVLPVFGDGAYQLQPVAVQAVAEGFAQALTTDSAHERTFMVGGPDKLAYTEILDRITKGWGHDPKPKAHVPLALAKLGVNTVGKLGLLPISPAQFAMLIGGNTGHAEPFNETFDVSHRPFTPRSLRYLRGR
jgi:NADH dehydrogenase